MRNPPPETNSEALAACRLPQRCSTYEIIVEYYYRHRYFDVHIGIHLMKLPRFGRLEFQIMEMFWQKGACSVREIQEAFPERKRPAYTTVQTTVYRLES